MPKKKPNKRILALSPGKRCVGVCVTRKGELMLAGVKTFRGEGNAKQARDYAAKLIRDVKPGVLVLGKRSGKGDTFADGLYQAIEEIAERSKVKVRFYSALRIKRALCGNEKATRYEVAQAAVEQHGELARYLYERGSEKEKYWRGMFDAVALGMV